MEKQTAVEWLVEQISYTTTNKEIISYHKDISELVNQSLEMEKQQIIKAHGNKKKHARDTGNYQYTYTGEMYFNDNYY